MTATATLPLLVECASCHSTYVVPNGPPASRYNAEQAVAWQNGHECSAIPPFEATQ